MRELVVRLVRGDRIFNPVAQRYRTRLSQELTVDLQHIGPLVRPEFDERGTSNQVINQCIATRSTVTGDREKGSNLVCRWWQARQINEYSPHELLVGAQITGEDFDSLQFLADQFVDVVVRRWII